MLIKKEIVHKSPVEVNEGNQYKTLQEKNKVWWENNPMQYDWNTPVGFEKDAVGYFEEIDNRMFAAHSFVTESAPFDKLMDYSFIRGKRVLEIGVGQGSHAALLANSCAEYFGIDITKHAVERTNARFQIHKLHGTIELMDAENMTFPDGYFDYIWSWGVIHHSSNTVQCLREIFRVLKPSGKCTFMVYNRSKWVWYIHFGLCYGFLLGGFFKHKTLSIINLSVIRSDGFLARYYRKKELIKLLQGLGASNISFKVTGNPAEFILLPSSSLKTRLLKFIPYFFYKWFLEGLEQGSMLVTTFYKR